MSEPRLRVDSRDPLLSELRERVEVLSRELSRVRVPFDGAAVDSPERERVPSMVEGTLVRVRVPS